MMPTDLRELGMPQKRFWTAASWDSSDVTERTRWLQKSKTL